MACSSSRVLSRSTLPSASSTRVKVRASRYTPSLGKVAKAVAISRVLTPRDRPPRDRGAMAMSLTVWPLMVWLADQGQVEPLGPVLKALGRGHQIGQHPHRHGVEGVLHRRVDGDLSPGSARPHSPARRFRPAPDRGSPGSP